MREINGVYTQAFIRRQRLAGHVLKGRFEAPVVDRDSYMLARAAYFVQRDRVEFDLAGLFG